MAAPTTPIQQQNVANNNGTPANQGPTLAEEMDADNSSESSDDTEVVQLREQVTSMATEMDNLREMLQQAIDLQTQQAHNNNNGLQEMRNLANTVTHGKEAGEILKPNPPEMFDGTPSKLPTFITQCRTFMSYYPTQFYEHADKVKYAAGRLKGTAAQWFQPVMEEWTNKANIEDLEPRAYMLFTNYQAFEKALQQAFGTINEKGHAERKIKAIRQTRSASELGAEFLQLASKLPWDQDALMSLFFDALKEPVQAELYKESRPKTLVEYINMAVRIDDYQYTWRTRNSRYNNKRQDTRPRYDANQGRRRDNNTSYGTAPGPMVIAAVKRDKSKITCWNCGKKGHFDAECKNPVKTNQKYKPVPEGKNNRATKQAEDSEPQMAVRSTHRIAMTRSGYDNPETYHQEQNTTVRDHCISEQEALDKANGVRVSKYTMEEKKERARESCRRRRAKKREQENENKPTWTWVPEGPKEQPQGATIAMVRKGKEIAPKQDKELSTDEVSEGVHQALDLTFEKLGTPIERNEQGDIVAIRTNQETGPYSSVDEIPVRTQQRRPNRHYGDPNYSEANRIMSEIMGRELRRSSKSKEERQKKLRHMTKNPVHPEIYVRSCTKQEVEQGSHPTPKFMHEIDPRIMPDHEEHHDISWVSCLFAECNTHRQWKEGNNCFPICIPGNSYKNPYGLFETYGYRSTGLLSTYGITELVFNQQLYDTMAQWTRTTLKVIPWNRKAQRAMTLEEAQEIAKREELECTPHDYENCEDSQQCGYNHLAFYTAEMKRLENEMTQEETEDQLFNQSLGKLMNELDDMTKNQKRHL
jgi:hypothetical protein